MRIPIFDKTVDDGHKRVPIFDSIFGLRKKVPWKQKLEGFGTRGTHPGIKKIVAKRTVRNWIARKSRRVNRGER